MEDGLEDDAMDKKHCTIGQALMAGLKMGADQIILTHFSQRYTKFPNLTIKHANEKNNSTKNGDNNIQVHKLWSDKLTNFLIAFDFMTVRFGDLPWTTKTV